MIFLIAGFLLIGLIDLLPLIEMKRRRELIVTGTIFVLGALMGLFYVLGITIPSPVVMLGNFFEEVLHLSY